MTKRGPFLAFFLLGFVLAIYLALPRPGPSNAARPGPASGPATQSEVAAPAVIFQIIDNPLRNLGETHAEGSNFGSEAAIGDFDGDGHDDLAIGAPGSVDAAVGDSGQVFVFWGDDEGVDDQRYSVLTDPESRSGDRFGMRLETLPGEALSEPVGHDQLLVSAPGRVSGDVRTGAVLVVDLRLDTLVEVVPPDTQEGMRFGSSVVCGDVDLDGSFELLIGARRGHPEPKLLPTGVVYVYDLEQLDEPVLRLANADHRNGENTGNENFGKEIALSYRDGEVEGVVISAIGNSDGDERDGGVAYLYPTPLQDGSFPIRSWVSPIPALDRDGIRRFGMSVAGSREGNGVAVGSPRHDLPMASGESAATAGLVMWYPEPRNGAAGQRMLTRADSDLVEPGQYFGFMNTFVKLRSAEREDLLVISLGESSNSTARIFLYDTRDPEAQPARMSPPEGSSSHFAQYPEFGQLGSSAPDGGRETVVLCDPYWDPVPGTAELHTGRVVLMVPQSP